MTEAPRQFGNQEANLDFIEKTGVFAQPVVAALEIGSGTGALLQHLRNRGYNVRGVEMNPALVEEGRRQFGDLPIQIVTGTTLPARDAEFQVVMSFDVFEHIPDSDAHLAEVRRVLVPGGSYLIQTPNKWSNTVFETIRWRSFTKFREDHCSLHTLGELEARLGRHGFEPRAYDVPVVNDFFRQKVRRHLGSPGIAALAIVNPDHLPIAWRTNLYVRAIKQT
jgi:SAM-dependent methyltransferase